MYESQECGRASGDGATAEQGMTTSTVEMEVLLESYESMFGIEEDGCASVSNMLPTPCSEIAFVPREELVSDLDLMIAETKAPKREYSSSGSQDSGFQAKAKLVKTKSKHRRKSYCTSSCSAAAGEMPAKRRKTNDGEIGENEFEKKSDGSASVSSVAPPSIENAFGSQNEFTSVFDLMIPGEEVRKRKYSSGSKCGSEDSTLKTDRLKHPGKSNHGPENSEARSSSTIADEIRGNRKNTMESDSDQESSSGESEFGKRFDKNSSAPNLTPSFGRSFASRSALVSDFDLMLAERKARKLTAPKRRAKDEESLINYNEGQIRSLLMEMKAAAAVDRELYSKGFPATKKITLFPRAMSQLVKLDLRDDFMENDVLRILTDWLTPMADGSLPAAKIRESFLKLIAELPKLDLYELKACGLGKAVVKLVAHPRETDANKAIGRKLIQEWALPMFACQSPSVAEPAKHKRPKDDRGRKSNPIPVQKPEEPVAVSKSRGLFGEPIKPRQEQKGMILPGDPNWVPRAVRPALPVKNYINRPKWTSKTDISKAPRKNESRLDRCFRNFKRMKDLAKSKRAVTVSINGRN